MLPRVYTVTQLNDYVHGLLSRDPMLRGVRVQGEISGFKRHSSGHLYFSLKDKGGLVRCVMFRTAASGLSFIPKDGAKIVVLADASLYQRDGQFQLYVHAMEMQGEGELYKEFLLLKSKLESKGYFNPQHKKELPLLPKRVGIITSPTGAALQDILQIIKRRYPKMDVCLFPVLVQGDGAAKEIANAIRWMNKNKSASVIIVGRGGGSMEDLWAFNEEKLVVAIYESEIPIISAVGHETDYTLTDFAADLRAPTPSAAAELCVPEYTSLMLYVDGLCQRLISGFAYNLEKRRERVLSLLKNRGFITVSHNIYSYKKALDTNIKMLDILAKKALEENKSKANHLVNRIHSLSPLSMLARGFAYVEDKKGNTVSSVNDLNQGMEVKLTLQDGFANATIGDTYKKE